MCFRDSCRKEEEEEEDPTKLVNRRTGNYDAGRLDESAITTRCTFGPDRPGQPAACWAFVSLHFTLINCPSYGTVVVIINHRYYHAQEIYFHESSSQVLLANRPRSTVN